MTVEFIKITAWLIIVVAGIMAIKVIFDIIAKIMTL